MNRSAVTVVHVLSDDERVRSAAQSLPVRFSVTLSDRRRDALVAAEDGIDIAVIELSLGGFGFAKEIARAAGDKPLRIVMLCDRKADLWLAKQAGAHDVIVKPLDDFAQLARAVGA